MHPDVSNQNEADQKKQRQGRGSEGNEPSSDRTVGGAVCATAHITATVEQHPIKKVNCQIVESVCAIYAYYYTHIYASSSNRNLQHWAKMLAGEMHLISALWVYGHFGYNIMHDKSQKPI